MLLTRESGRYASLEQEEKNRRSPAGSQARPSSCHPTPHPGWNPFFHGNRHPQPPQPPYMATKNGSPSTRPSSGGEQSVARDAANGHRPPEVKQELPEPGEIVTESSHSQESPLDFSVKRKSMGVYHESFTDDSQASSSAGSPPLQSSSRLLGGSPPTLEQPSPYSFGEKAGSSSPSGFHGLDFGQAARVRESEQPYMSPAVGGFPPGMIPTNGSKMAFPNLNPILDPRRVHGGSSKTTRPFKAYPREALSMPVGGMYMPNLFPLAGIEPSVLQNLSISTEELMTIYKQQLQLARERDKHIAAMARTSSMLNGASPRTTSGGSTSSNSSGGHSASATPGSKPQSMSPPRTQQQLRGEQQDEHEEEKQLQDQQEHQDASQAPRSPHCDDLPASEAPVHPSPLTPQRPMPPPLTPTTPSTPTTPTSKSTPPLTSPFADIGTPSMVPCASSASATLVSSTSCSSNARKRPRTLPDDQKDDAYWERRRKNNEAAKRSRDARRAKEDEIAIRAALLEQENLKLRVEVAALKNETARLRCLLYNS